jgi:hypothetical protein
MSSHLETDHAQPTASIKVALAMPPASQIACRPNLARLRASW